MADEATLADASPPRFIASEPAPVPAERGAPSAGAPGTGAPTAPARGPRPDKSRRVARPASRAIARWLALSLVNRRVKMPRGPDGGQNGRASTGTRPGPPAVVQRFV